MAHTSPPTRVVVVTLDWSSAERICVTLESVPEAALVGESTDLAHARALATVQAAQVLLLCVPFDRDSGLVQFSPPEHPFTFPPAALIVAPKPSFSETLIGVEYGIRGWLTENDSPRDLGAILELAACGGYAICPTITHLVSQQIAAMRFRLHPRQRQIVQLVAQGRTNEQIAIALAMTPKNVEYHLKQIYQQVGARQRHELITLWLSSGWAVPLQQDDSKDTSEL